MVGSSARASLSDLYGSSGRTGAAERETGRVSARAEPPPLPPNTSPGSVSVLRGFCFIFASAEVYGISPKGAGERVASGLPGYDLVAVAAPEPASSAGSAPGARPSGEPAGRRVWGAWQRQGAQALVPASAQPPPRARSGEGRGRCSGDVAGAWRGLSGAPGGRRAESGSAACCPRDRPDRAGLWLLFCRPFPAFERPRGRALLGRRRKRLPPSGPLRTFSLSRTVGHAEDAPPRRHLCFWSPALSGRARGGRAARRWAGSPGAAGKGRGAGPTSRRKTEERRGRFARPRRGPLRPRHHGPG